MSPQAGEMLITEVQPRIHSYRHSFSPIGCEDDAELAQDALATAAQLLHSVEARGKTVTPGNIGYYAVRQVNAGRRSTGFRKNDVMHPATQLAGRSSLVSLEQPLSGEPDSDEPTCLHDLLADKTEDPSTAASRRLDWAPLVASLDGPVREVLLCLAQGQDLTTLVPKLKRSRSGLQGDKNRLAHLVRELLGEEVLLWVQQLPRWMNNLTANREKVACRVERQRA